MSVSDDSSSSKEEQARIDAARIALAALRDTMQTLQLATVGANGAPHTGYTPHVFDGADILIFVSQLAVHTRDLLAQPRAAVMLIADEADSPKIYARTRVSYECTATVIPSDAENYDALLDTLQARHGKMISLLRQLPDFVLFRLRPTRGQFVMGFGQAFRLSGEQLDEFEHARSG